MNEEAKKERTKNFDQFYLIKKISLSNGDWDVINYIPKTFTFSEVLDDIRYRYNDIIVDSNIIYPCKLIINKKTKYITSYNNMIDNLKNDLNVLSNN